MIKYDCSNCKFLAKNGTFTVCRRYPPFTASSALPAFPIVGKDMWCGEHQFKVAEPTP